MNFVQMVERLRVECGVSGQPITDLTTLRGEHARLRNWVGDAWLDVQREAGGLWEFLRVESSHTIPLYGSLLDISEWLAGSVNIWKGDSFRIAGYAEPRGRSIELAYMDYDDFKVSVGLDPSTRGKPQYFTVRRSDKAIIVAPAADQQYTLYYDYWQEPVGLDDNTDTIALSTKYHMLPVYRAMLDYGYFEAAPEALARAQKHVDDMMFTLRLEQLPPVQFGGPLA